MLRFMYKKVYHENFLKGNVFFKIVQQKRMTQLHPCDDMSITMNVMTSVRWEMVVVSKKSGRHEKIPMIQY